MDSRSTEGEKRSQTGPAAEDPPQTRLVDVDVKDPNMALNVMVSFLNLANKRGAFSLDESAKIWECASKFGGAQPPPASGGP